MDDSLLDEIIDESSQLQIESDASIEIFKLDDEDKLPYICCFCGRDKYHHQGSTHKFIPIKLEYRCKKCYGYLFEHRDAKNKCTFSPYKYM